MKFSQLLEFYMRNIFLKNHTQNAVEKLFSDPLLQNQNWAYLWINNLKFYTVCFYCMPSWGLSKYIETKLQTTGLYLIIELFFKNKNRYETSLPASSYVWFLKKNFSCYILLLIKFHCLVAFTSWEYIMCIVIVC